MQKKGLKRVYRIWLFSGLALVGFIFLFLSIVAERFVEPLLKARLHTLIIQGSDSLYTYTLGGLRASFLGGNVEVENLHIHVDSSRFQALRRSGELPAVTMELTLLKGKIHGVALFPLLFGRKISIHQITSHDADIRLIRLMIPAGKKSVQSPPLWKAIQPVINSIRINHISLDGVKFLYRHEDTAQSLKLQFDTCYAQFNDIMIDSASAADKERVGFAKELSMRFRDLKFRSADSSIKLKAEVITYSSRDRTFEVTDFKMQPTLKVKEDFYSAAASQKPMSVIEFSKATLTNFRIDQFIRNNLIAADSLLILQPLYSIYIDKTRPPLYQSKMGTYPHQKLMNASFSIRIKGIGIRHGQLAYTERGEKSGKEGTVLFSNVQMQADHVTNDKDLIQANPVSTATIQGSVWGSSPFQLKLRFYLDSANGSFGADGFVKNVTASQINKIAIPLGNVQFESFHMQQMDFALTGNDFGSRGTVRMRYNHLFLTMLKWDKKTGNSVANNFLTKVINKYTVEGSNPGTDGIERIAKGVVRARPTSQPFFGLVWKTIFTGMQAVMIGSSTRY